MENGNFYYLTDQYFCDFPDTRLMQNKENTMGKIHDRPCYYAFQDTKTGLYWMIPISSQVQKFRKYYNSKIEKFGRCDTIVFGEIMGYEKAFLIQNMCPVTLKYIKNEYIDNHAGIPVRVTGILDRLLVKKAKSVLALQRKGKQLIFPDVLKIEEELLNPHSEN